MRLFLLLRLALLSQACLVELLAFAPLAFSAPTTTPRLSTVATRAATSSSSSESSLHQSPSGTTPSIPVAKRSELLDDALGFNATAASELLSEVNQLRGASQEEAEAFASSLLDSVDGGSTEETTVFPWWTRLRPLTRVSRRARRASLRRVLDLSTPTVEETTSMGDDKDAERRRRRRSLVILIRALSEDNGGTGDETLTLPRGRNKRVPAIVQLERAARREAKSLVNAQDMANRLPTGLETPNYMVLSSRRRGGYEVRRYEPFSVCSVVMGKPRPEDSSRTDAKISNPQLAGASAFGALAGYLFGKNKDSSSMKMTTPVLSQGEDDNREMSFVLPSEFWNDGALASAPQPLDGSGVTLKTRDGEERAVVMFGGFAGKKDVQERTKQLLGGLAYDKEWMPDSNATVILAQYNDPFTPPWKRRNEVSVKLVPR